MSTVTLGWPLAGLLLVLAAPLPSSTRLAGLGQAGGVVIAAIRAVVQLAAVSLVIGFVLRSLALTAVFLLLMVDRGGRHLGTPDHRVAPSPVLVDRGTDPGRSGPDDGRDPAQRCRCRSSRSRSCRPRAS